MYSVKQIYVTVKPKNHFLPFQTKVLLRLLDEDKSLMKVAEEFKNEISEINDNIPCEYEVFIRENGEYIKLDIDIKKTDYKMLWDTLKTESGYRSCKTLLSDSVSIKELMENIEKRI